MPLEDLTGPNKFISDLVREWPLGTDPFAQGDDHIRGVKNTLRNSLPTVAQARYPVSFLLPPAGESEEKQGAIEIAAGTIAQRPDTPPAGALRWNSEIPQIEYVKGAAWKPLDAIAAKGDLILGDDDGGQSALKVEPVGVLQSGGDNVIYGFPRGHIDVDPASYAGTVITTGAGECRCENISNAMALPVMNKDFSAPWAEGNNQGGVPPLLLPTVPSTWYRFYALLKDDFSVDYGWDTDPAAVNLLAAAGASYIGYRRILWTRTGVSGAIRPTGQLGSRFWFLDMYGDGILEEDNITDTPRDFVVQECPPLTFCQLNVRVNRSSTSSSGMALFYQTDQTSGPINDLPGNAGHLASSAAARGDTQIEGLLVDASQRLRVVSINTLTSTLIGNVGWRDPRGAYG